MKKILIITLTALVFTASSCKKDIKNSSSTNETLISNRTSPSTTLYISGTMHIESDRMKWPDIDSLKCFFDTATHIGLAGTQTTAMKWSIGPDIGWLIGEPRAAELITYTEALGVEWDVHGHNLTDRPLCYQQITTLGGHPTTVCSGMQTSQVDSMKTTIANGSASFTATVFWGMTYNPTHGAASDLTYSGCWRPTSSINYLTPASTGPVNVGGYIRRMGAVDSLAMDITANPAMYKFPVTSATVMIDPQTYTTPLVATETISVLKSFATRVGAYSNVKWGTINQTATAWIAAGGTSSRK